VSGDLMRLDPGQNILAFLTVRHIVFDVPLLDPSLLPSSVPSIHRTLPFLPHPSIQSVCLCHV